MAGQSAGKTPLGKLILRELYLQGKNQRWLAEQIGVNPNHICVLLSKTKFPRSDTLLKISKALNIDIAELYQAIEESGKDLL